MQIAVFQHTEEIPDYLRGVQSHSTEILGCLVQRPDESAPEFERRAERRRVELATLTYAERYGDALPPLALPRAHIYPGEVTVTITEEL